MEAKGREVVTYFGQLYRYLRRAKITPVTFIPPAAFAGLASVFEGLTLALLIPTIQVILQPDYTLRDSVPTLARLFEVWMPGGMLDRKATLFLLVVLTFASAVARTALEYLSSLATAYQIRHFANQLRILIYARYLSFGKLFFDQHSSGYLHQIVTSYVSYVTNGLNSVQSGIYVICTLLVYVTMMFLISWKLTLVVCTVFPILHFSLAWLIKRIAKTSDVHAQALNALGVKVSNSLSSIPLIKAYCLEARECEAFKATSDQVSAFEYSIEKKSLLVGPLQEVILLCFVLLLVGLMALVARVGGANSLADYAVYILVLKRSASMFGMLNVIQATLASVSGALKEVEKVFSDNDKHFVPDGVREFEGLTDGIELSDLHFSYPGGVNALRGVSCRFECGKTTAIVGHTGSGKSTILNLINRFYDCEPGQILADGFPISEFTLRSWRGQIAWVSQDAYLFHATLRENLVYGLSHEISPNELARVISSARLDELVERLPNGLETQVGDKGVKLSGGEKQRVSIARAMLKNATILLLDEATSALDSCTERLIQSALEELTTGKTTIIVAHRLSTIKHADWVVVIEQGQVAEQGSFKELVHAKGRFSEYWQEQRIL